MILTLCKSKNQIFRHTQNFEGFKINKNVFQKKIQDDLVMKLLILFVI